MVLYIIRSSSGCMFSLCWHGFPPEVLDLSYNPKTCRIDELEAQIFSLDCEFASIHVSLDYALRNRNRLQHLCDIIQEVWKNYGCIFFLFLTSFIYPFIAPGRTFMDLQMNAQALNYDVSKLIHLNVHVESLNLTSQGITT